MKKLQHFYTVLLICFCVVMGSAQVTGRWKTDDTDGKEKDVVEIYEKHGKLYGKIVKLSPAIKNPVCSKCSGELKDQPIVGMVVLKDLTITNTGGRDGKVLDPHSGKTYSCNVELVEPDKLKMRGYIGMSAIGRTQYLYRVD